MKRAGRMAAGNRTRKQFSFDLVQERLRRHYSSTSPANAYTELRDFLESNGFRHIEGSVYESEKVLSKVPLRRSYAETDEKVPVVR